MATLEIESTTFLKVLRVGVRRVDGLLFRTAYRLLPVGPFIYVRASSAPDSPLDPR